MKHKFTHLFTIVFLILIIATSCNRTEWGYKIGQEEIPAVVIQDSLNFKVYPDHPRLFFRDTDLPEIRKRINGDFKPEWDELVNHLETYAMTKPAATFGQGSYLKSWETGRAVAFLAVVTEDDRYIKWAKEWAEKMVADGPIGIDDNYRGRLQSLGVAYDWLYQWLSDDEKQRYQKAIIDHIDKNWSFAEKADYISGHSRWGNSALVIGLLSIVTEKPELQDKLMILRNHWLNGYHPFQGWVAVDGGYHMGWSYSAAYLTGDNHCVWSSATNDCVYYPWQALLPQFWIYARQGDGDFPNTGDAYTHFGFSAERELHMIAAGILKDPYAAWLTWPTTDRFGDILYGNKNVKPVAPDDPSAPLPLSKHFRNAGVVMARDRWDENTTSLQFKSTSFYSANHHHRDENSFTLHYKGQLAIDAGYYDNYGTSHWHNYFTRTIAHNSIVVFDPGQSMSNHGKEISNDGGQTYRSEPRGLSEAIPGGHAHLDGITGYRDNADYTWSAGDATKAYDAEYVKLAQREIVYLRKTPRKHPVILVFDRVESTKPQFEKKFLLHTINEPVIIGKITTTEHKGGRLSCLTLLPDAAQLKLIGGPGKEYVVDNINYPVEDPAKIRAGREPGSWRLEVSPREKNTMDYFLHVLFVDDAGSAPVVSDEARMTENENSFEVIVAGWKVNFPKVKGETAVVKE